MTELQQYQGAELAAPSGLPAAAGALVEWAQALRSAKFIADALSGTAFCPQQFRGKPEEAAAAILAGSEVGLSPRAALGSYDIIQGTAAPKAITFRAIVQSRGHDMWVVESSDTRAVVKGRRAGQDEEHQSVWTMERARGLGLTGKDNWKKQPGAMLVARATAECARFVASDAILGIGYTSEEIQDQVDGPLTAKVAKTTRRRAAATRVERPTLASATRTTESASGPPLPDDDIPALEEAASITEAQMKKMQAIFTSSGIKDRERRLSISSFLVHRELSSSSDLTKAEANTLIDTLEQLAEQGPLAEMIDALLSDDSDPYLPDDPDLAGGAR
jgi:hypothetical protein